MRGDGDNSDKGNGCCSENDSDNNMTITMIFTISVTTVMTYDNDDGKIKNVDDGNDI